MCRGEMSERLRLLYELHLPPALLPEDLESPSGDTQTGIVMKKNAKPISLTLCSDLCADICDTHGINVMRANLNLILIMWINTDAIESPG